MDAVELAGVEPLAAPGPQRHAGKRLFGSVLLAQQDDGGLALLWTGERTDRDELAVDSGSRPETAVPLFDSALVASHVVLALPSALYPGKRSLHCSLHD